MSLELMGPGELQRMLESVARNFRDPLPIKYRVRLEALAVAAASKDGMDSPQDVVETATLYEKFVLMGEVGK